MICVDVPSERTATHKETQINRSKKERQIMSNSNGNKIVVPNAREAMNKFKMEAASDLRVPAPS